MHRLHREVFCGTNYGREKKRRAHCEHRICLLGETRQTFSVMMDIGV